jgi:hypothetical protein
VAINCPRFLQIHGSVRKSSLERVTFRDNLVFGPIDKADHESFPQTDEGRKRADFRPEVLEDIADPDVNRFKVQTGSEFRKLAPWFKRIPLEKIGLNRERVPDTDCRATGANDVPRRGENYDAAPMDVRRLSARHRRRCGSRRARF